MAYGPRIIKAYLRVIRPFMISNLDIDEVATHLRIDPSILTVGGTGVKVKAPFSGQFTSAVKFKGYDGIVTNYEIVVWGIDQVYVVS